MERALQIECLHEVEKAFVKAEEHFGQKFDRVPVTFSNRMTHTAGRAFFSTVGGVYRGKEIRLSNKLMMSEGEKFVSRTPGHEAAHIIALAVFGKAGSGHGVFWKEVMNMLGLSTDRCHSYEVPKKKVFTYVKDGVTKELTIIRHNKLQRGNAVSYIWKDGVEMHKHNWVVL